MRTIGKWFILVSLFVLVGCAAEGPDSNKNPSHSLENQYAEEMGNLYAPYENGTLVQWGSLKCFDGNTKQLVPVCTRAECLHEYEEFWHWQEAECPAAQIALKMEAAVVYEGKLWSVRSEEDKWEIWRADTNGENLVCVHQIEMEQMFLDGGNTLFYQGRFYGTVIKLLEDEIGRLLPVSCIVSIDLKNGEVSELTETVPLNCLMLFLGAHKDQVYYRVWIRDESGENVTNTIIYRVSQETGKQEMVAEGNIAAAAMDEEWLVYYTKEDKITVYLKNLETDTTKIIWETALKDMGTPCEISNGKVVWNDLEWEAETNTYRCVYHIYDIASGSLQATLPYSRPYQIGPYIAGGWLLDYYKTTEESTPDASNEDNQLVYYISEEDFLAGKEPTLLR